MGNILNFLSGSRQSRGSDDEVSDRLSHRVSASLLLLVAGFTFAQQSMARSISCWHDSQTLDTQQVFINDFCWANGLYSLGRDSRQVHHYQYLPLLLLLMAAMFAVPRLVWRLISDRSGVQLLRIVEVAADASEMKDEVSRARSVQYVSQQFLQAMNCRRGLRIGWWSKLRQACSKYLCCFCASRKFGNTLVLAQILTRLLYFINCVLQLLIMQQFVTGAQQPFGMIALRNLLTNDKQSNFTAFPKMVKCFFKERISKKEHDLDCVLNGNIFNENVFIFLWFWEIFIAVVSLLSFISSVRRFILPSSRAKFVKRFLKQHKLIDRSSTRELSNFINASLKPDGVLALSLIEHSAGHLMAADVTAHLWQLHVAAAAANGSKGAAAAAAAAGVRRRPEEVPFGDSHV